jgi:NAD(P)-dependent dehydrogenase (short-subunit alcohol dehydrogenase family)
MQQREKKRVVVVTGASAGVGRAVVREFAGEGARVGLVARGSDGLDGARRDVENAGGEAIAVSADVANAADVEAAAERIERELGPIDVWVNNAMTSVFSLVRELEPAEVERVTQVTYLGAVYGTLSALRRMIPRDRGIIIQVGSALAYRSIPLQAAYCGAKHAIAGFTDSLRCELIHEKSRVRVTVVHLPAMNTPQFDWVRSRLPRRAQPVPPIFQPEVAARAIARASRQDRREVWVGGPTVEAILGQRIAPGWLDRYLGATGFDAQQTGEPRDPTAPDNLWSPVPGDHGAHGRFDARSRDESLEVRAAEHRGWLVAGALALVGAGLAAWRAV